MRLVMGLHSFVAVMGRMEMVGVREMRVVRCLFMMAGGVMLGGMVMVLGCVLVVLSGFGVVRSCHVDYPYVIFKACQTGTANVFVRRRNKGNADDQSTTISQFGDCDEAPFAM